jgi:DnaJ-class molecular chaperone
MQLQINLTESLCGFQRVITLLDAHTILINHPAGKPIAPNSYRRLQGYGMPNRNSHTHGDLIIHFDVKFPEEGFITSDSQRQVSSFVFLTGSTLQGSVSCSSNWKRFFRRRRTSK